MGLSGYLWQYLAKLADLGRWALGVGRWALGVGR